MTNKKKITIRIFFWPWENTWEKICKKVDKKMGKVYEALNGENKTN